MNKKPKHFLIFKIAAVLGVIALIGGIVLSVSGFGNFESNSFMIGGLLTAFGVMITGAGVFIGFGPEFAKMRTKSVKYIQQETKKILKILLPLRQKSQARQLLQLFKQ